jgi:sterol 3beta-glucosyltransferase
VVDKDKGKDATHFTVVTHQRNFNFKADSIPSAKEWVKSLQKIIFRTHNDGDSIKISLPIENIIDIEDSQIVDFADTCKIRVIDNDETYAIDEVSTLMACLSSLTNPFLSIFSLFLALAKRP